MSAASLKFLTPRHGIFVREYLATSNGAEAARRAGYSARRARITACELLRRQPIRREMNRLQLSLLELWGDQVIGGLVAAANYEGNGSSALARVQAWTLLAEIIGLIDRDVTSRNKPSH